MSDVQSLLNQLAQAINNQVVKVELHHYHHHVVDPPKDPVVAKNTEACPETTLKASNTDPPLYPGLYHEIDYAAMAKKAEIDPASALRAHMLSVALLDEPDTRGILKKTINDSMSLEEPAAREIPCKSEHLSKISTRAEAENVATRKSHYSETPATDITPPRKIPSRVPHSIESISHADYSKDLMSATELNDVLDDVMGEFDMSSYIEEKRKAGAETKKKFDQTAKKETRNLTESSRKNNVEDDDVMEKFFKNEIEKSEPEPPKITPLLRYKKDDQQKIQMRIFREAKKFVMECNPGKNSEDLEQEIMEEADKRLTAWSDSHYTK